MIPGRITVVVPVYNHARYLPRRMESLLRQTYPDVEIIAIDDRSPDDSLEVLRRCAPADRVRIVARAANGGWVETFNQGLSLASGEFVLFANSDDDCRPNLLEALAGALKERPSAGLAFCRSRMIDGEGRPLGFDLDLRTRAFRRRCAADTLVSGREMERFLLHSCVIPNMSAVLLRAAAFARTGPFTHNYKVCGDWEFYLRLARHYDFAYVAEPLNEFRQHAENIRTRAKGRLLVGEYIRLLLGEERRLELTLGERARVRARAMSLWAAHLIAPSLDGLRDFPEHLGLAWRHDPLALAWLPPMLALRFLSLPGKLAV